MPENPRRPAYELPAEPPAVGERAFFRTLAGPDDTEYPEESSDPTVYYAERVKNVTFEKTVGTTTITVEQTGVFEYVYNLALPNYLPVGTVCLAFKENARWFTADPVEAGSVDVVCRCHDGIETPNPDAADCAQIYDETFDLANDWEITEFLYGCGTSTLAAEQDTTEHAWISSAPSLKLTPGGSTTDNCAPAEPFSNHIRKVFIYSGYQWDPATDGELDQVDMSLFRRNEAGGNSIVGFPHMACSQGGSIYHLPVFLRRAATSDDPYIYFGRNVAGGSNWRKLVEYGFDWSGTTPSGHQTFGGTEYDPLSRPDFTAAGDPIKFGFSVRSGGPSGLPLDPIWFDTFCAALVAK